MFRNITKLLITLITTTSIIACDDKDDVEDTPPVAGAEMLDASVSSGTDAETQIEAGTESDIPVQMMQFDTMEIEPDPDMGPDMDD